jgi:tungstate transport system ATP-binding protein
MRDRPVRDIPTTLPIRFEHVAFAAGATSILHDVTLSIPAGPPTVLLGPNGSGKTSLLKLAMGLLTPIAGRIVYAEREGVSRRRHAFVFQKPVMLRRSVERNVAFALKAAGRAADAATIDRLLDTVGLGPLAARPARRLSGGEQQRLALARAFARDPEVLFLDEPTSSLDPFATKSVEDIISRTATAGVKIVMATHDLGQARRLAGDIVFLANGVLVEHSRASIFFDSPTTPEAKRFLAGELVI